MSMILAICLIIGYVEAQPDYFEKQDRDYYCYIHTVNNVIGSYFYSSDYIYRLAKNLDVVQTGLFPDQRAHRADYVSYTSARTAGPVSITQDGYAKAPLLIHMFGIAGFSFKYNTQQVPDTALSWGNNVWYPDLHLKTDILITTKVTQALSRSNFRGFVFHMEYSIEWTHFTSIIKEDGNYFYLDPCFPIVNTIGTTKNNDWSCDAYNPPQYPRLKNGLADCRRLEHYKDGYFNYLTSKTLGADTTAAAVIQQVINLKTGYGPFTKMDGDEQITYYQSKMIWMMPIFTMTDQQYFTYMQNYHNYATNPSTIYGTTKTMPVDNTFLKRQRSEWRMTKLIDLLRTKYQTDYTAGRGFYSAANTVDNGKGGKIGRTCKVQTTQPEDWSSDQVKEGKLAEWRRQREGECGSDWHTSNLLPLLHVPDLFNEEFKNDDHNYNYINYGFHLFDLVIILIMILIISIGFCICLFCCVMIGGLLLIKLILKII